jgi:hypothetical protein
MIDLFKTLFNVFVSALLAKGCFRFLHSRPHDASKAADEPASGRTYQSHSSQTMIPLAATRCFKSQNLVFLIFGGTLNAERERSSKQKPVVPRRAGVFPSSLGPPDGEKGERNEIASTRNRNLRDRGQRRYGPAWHGFSKSDFPSEDAAQNFSHEDRLESGDLAYHHECLNK